MRCPRFGAGLSAPRMTLGADQRRCGRLPGWWVGSSRGEEPAGGGVELGGRLHLENLVTFGQGDPGLLAAGPDMPSRPQPRGIVERARTHPDHAVPRHAANPGTALRAYQTGIDPPTVRGALERSRRSPAETKGSLGHDDSHREGAAGQALAIGAVARVDQLRSFGDLVTNLAALTAAGLRKLHRLVPPNQGRQPVRGGPV